MKHCRALRNITEPLRNVVAFFAFFARTAKQALWKRYRALRSRYGTLWNRYGKYWFCLSLIKFWILLIIKISAWVLYIKLHYMILPLRQKPKKFTPPLTEDITPSSNWNYGKMKIACNSVYAQTETLNFTFARQTIIVYCYISSKHRRGYCRNKLVNDFC